MKKFLPKLFIAAVLFLKVEVGCGQYVPISGSFSMWLVSNGFSSCVSGSQLDTTSIWVTNTKFLDFGNGGSAPYLTDLDGLQYFDSLESFSVIYSPVNHIGLLPLSLKSISISHDTASLNFTSFPDSLIFLYLDDVNISTLPPLPNTLKALTSNQCPIEFLPTLPQSLSSLTCSQCSLDSLPSLPSFLQVLNVNGNYTIDTLPQLPNSLLSLSCGGNILTSLPSLPNGLRSLACYFNHIQNLPVLPDSLRFLHCGYGYLTSLPTLPDSLDTLICYSTTIPNFPAFPNSIKYLDINHNYQISNLPPLPNSLQFLNCSYNVINGVLSLPNTLTNLYCNNSFSLQGFSNLPDSLNFMDISNCPNLHCLPEIKKIFFLLFSNTTLGCIPNYGNVLNSNPSLSSLPLCDLFNPNGCSCYWNISGKVFVDSSNNCIDDYNEMQLANVKLLLDSAGIPLQQTYTITDGKYSFDTDTGTYNYTVDTTNLPVLVTCPVAGFQTSVLTALDSMHYDRDFGMQCKPGFDVGVKTATRDSGMFFPGNFARVNFLAGDITNFYGLQCAAGVSGTMRVEITGNATFVSAAAGSLTPVVSGDTLTYTIADFGNINANNDFKIIVQTDVVAQMGDLICFSINVTPVANDLNVSNNYLQQCFSVANSFDPNDKQVFPVGNFDSTQTWLTYTINFQNTGNAPAQHIYILDTLNSNLDETSFELLAYSHQPVTQIIGNVARFNFPNINLPDSVNDEPHSHGYVQYRIKLKTGLAQGTVITNTAHIVFDFNAPVVTNTVTNALQDCSQLQLATLTVNNTSICKNDSLTATATLAFPMLVSWFVDGVFVGNNLSITTDTLSAGNHVITLTTTNSVCSQTITQTIFVDEPLKPTFNQNGNLLTSSAATGNQWYLNSAVISGATQNTFTISQSGYYMVAATDSLGCVAFSDSMWVSPVGIDEMHEQNIFVSPNPFTNQFEVSGLKFEVGDRIEIMDVLGKIVFNKTLASSTSNLKLQTLKYPAGVYELQIICNDKILRKKIIKH